MKTPGLASRRIGLKTTAGGLLLVCVSLIARAQTVAMPSASPTSSIPDPNSIILQYQAALRSETQEYRHSLQEEMERIKLVIDFAVPIAAGIFLFLNWNSRREIRSQVKARFKVALDAEIENRLAGFDAFLAENRRKIEQTDQFLELIYDLTFAFHVLSVKLDDPEWDAARRDAESRLQGWRRQLPDSRRLAILLGRLYKHFHDYDAGIRVLTEVMAERDKKQLPQDVDYAALLYNRACYETLRAATIEASDPREAQALRGLAWRDINFSIALDPTNNREAKEDPDLVTLWNKCRKEDLGKMKLSDFRQSRNAPGSIAQRLRGWLRG